MLKKIPADVSEFEMVYSVAENCKLDNEDTIRAVKKDKIMQFDENTIVKLKDCDFHNGVIKVKMLSRSEEHTSELQSLRLI